MKAAFSFYYHADWKHNKFMKWLIGREKRLFNITKDSCEQMVHVVGNLQTPLFYFQFLNKALKSEWVTETTTNVSSAFRSWTLALTPDLCGSLQMTLNYWTPLWKQHPMLKEKSLVSYESEHETRKDDHHWLNQSFAPFFWLLFFTNRFNESNNSKNV